MSDAISKIPIKIKVEGLGGVDGELIRIYAPLTVDNLLRILPIEGRAHPINGGVSFIIGIKRGEEKSVKKVEAGTICYWPRGDAVCLFYAPVSTHSPVNRVGKIKTNLDLMTNIKSGTPIRIYRANSA